MKVHDWKYTQFAQFNRCDSMLLVSGVHPGDNGTMGEIAVFSTRREFAFTNHLNPLWIYGDNADG